LNRLLILTEKKTFEKMKMEKWEISDININMYVVNKKDKGSSSQFKVIKPFFPFPGFTA
jgi:hypothetical protein